MSDAKLRLLGLANKAGFIVSGEDAVTHAIQKQLAKVVYIASDASSKTIDKFEKKCYFYKVTCKLEFTSAELTSALGKPRKIVALTNQGFYETLEKQTR